jgi:retron-type reverse transcriptase
MARIKFTHSYDSIISVENLLLAWREFRIGKRNRADVQEFEQNLMGNIISLHADLAQRTYKHAAYFPFNISDPKPRKIHKATVRDRLLHRAVYRMLYPFFNRVFIADSYSCRLEQGPHKAMNRFRTFSYKVSHNHTRTAWVLKCDVRKFFASINHNILNSILRVYITDKNLINLLEEILRSFHVVEGVGLPLGNLTSQLLANIYMNEFDQFMKHCMKVKYYIRYTDDFVILSHDKDLLDELLPKIADFLGENLKLELHPDKVSICPIASGADFLGWVHFPHHRILRTTTKRRMFKRIKERKNNESTIQSYLGLLSHGNTNKLRKIIAENQRD